MRAKVCPRRDCADAQRSMSLAAGPEAGQLENQHSCDRHPNEWPIVVSCDYIHQIANDADEEDSYRQRDAPQPFMRQTDGRQSASSPDR